MFSRSNHTDKGKLAKRKVKTSFKMTSQLNENTHPRSDIVEHLIDGYQLMNYYEGVCSRNDGGSQKSITLHISKLPKARPDV